MTFKSDLIQEMLRDHPKEKWYRMKEREKVTTPITQKFKMGDWLLAKRIIVRCGYYNSPLDMPDDLVREQTIDKIWHKANEIAAVKNGQMQEWMLRSLNHNLDKEQYTISREAVLNTINAAGGGRDIDDVLHTLAYEVRGPWLDEQNKTLPTDARWLRTFWYVDRDYMGQFEQMRNRFIGYRQSGGPCDEEGCDPPYLSVIGHQMLYKVTWGWATEAYIHPLDLVEG